MVQTGSVEVSSDTEVTDAIFSLNDRLLKAAESPWFSKIGRAVGHTVVGSSTVWGVPTPDGALIYARRSWNKHAAPVSLDGANRVRLSLQRPGEITENWLVHGVQYILETDGADDRGRLLLDGYEKEETEDEVLSWAEVDSPAALMQYIGKAVHAGRIYSAMHRIWAEYSALTSEGDVACLLGSKEALVKQGGTLTDRTLEISLDRPALRGTGTRRLLVEGSIAQTDPPDWRLTELQAFGELLGIAHFEDAIHQLTADELAYAQHLGNALLRHCAESIDEADRQASEAQQPIPTE